MSSYVIHANLTPTELVAGTRMALRAAPMGPPGPAVAFTETSPGLYHANNLPAGKSAVVVDAVDPVLPDGVQLLRQATGIVLDNGADEDFLTALVLKAGATTQHKRYFDFRGIDDLTKWRIGVNAANQFIVFDNQSDGTHLLLALPEAMGGHVQLNAQGSGATNLNSEIGSSNGGFHVYSGGAAPSRWHALDGTGHRTFIGGTETSRLTLTGNFGLRTSDFGTGVGVLGLKNAAVIPSTAPVNGGAIYVEAGALRYRGSAGTVTTLAPA